MKTTCSLLGLVFGVVASPLLGETDPPGSGSGLIVHEWGTFTSVQGSDGVQLEWRPLVGSDLPGFVYELSDSCARRSLSPARGTKVSLTALQRMETPVIYFYTGQEMTVEVGVRFPKGLITEWYPKVRELQPVSIRSEQKPPAENGSLGWGNIRLFPADKNPQLHQLLPVEDSGNHYFAARETDSAYVRVCPVTPQDQGIEYEKFLFYRGVGNFKAPLRAATTPGGRVQLDNATVNTELSNLFLLEVGDGKGRFLAIDRLQGGKPREIGFSPSQEWIALEPLGDEIGRQMEKALVSAGLYPREAAATVKTWRDSWFKEKGLRVLYTIPRAWTDEVLPLALNPRPKELVRVMVGRAELLAPAMEKRATDDVLRFNSGNRDGREEALESIRELGRNGEPALRRVAQMSGDGSVHVGVERMLDVLRLEEGR